MRIGFSTCVIQHGKTGVAQYVFALLQALRPYAAEHEFSLFVLENDRPLFEFARDSMRLVSVSETERPAVRNVWWHQSTLPGLCRNFGLDVLHVPSYRRMLWPRPCALVSTIHDLAPFHVRGKYDPARMFYGRVVVRYLARRQDAIIAISSNTARDIERFFGIPLQRQNVILNGIDHHRFRPSKEAPAQADAALRWGLEAPFFLYVSRLEHPGKNHVRLIEAFAEFKKQTGSPWLLALAGSDWHGAEAIHTAAQGSPYQRDIRFLGFVEDGSLPSLYRAAAAFVYPSLFEGFGFPPIEAMACGCPVLSSTRGALGEVVGEAALLVEPESIPNLAAGLTQLAQDEPLRQRLRTAGFVNAARFDWNKNAAAVMEVWERAVSRRTRPTGPTGPTGRS